MNNFKNTISNWNQSLDWNAVLGRISNRASFSLSKQVINDTKPIQDLTEIHYRLKLCQEALTWLQNGSDFDLQGLEDIHFLINKANKKMSLQPNELLKVLTEIRITKNVKSQLSKTNLPHIDDLVESIEIEEKLFLSLQRNIDAQGKVKEDATSLLKEKNRESFDIRDEISKKARNFIRSHSTQLMESVTTTVQSRTVFLVRAQDKNSFGGMIHGQSQSGQAFYVEPQEFVGLNNRLQWIEQEIEREKFRICAELSRLVSDSSSILLSNLDTLTILDVAFAKAKWAYKNDGCIPSIQTRDHAMLLEHAKHPLIDPKKVVSNTYRLDKNQACLMISGPNMGGKTVTLKTIGLCVCLAHSGFPVLCHRAILPFYKNLWFDIGDNQSIEHNLSTFSSHISKISEICNLCDENSFILLDEIGNGTDPLEGASLAISILKYLIQCRATIITSTHYSQVKTFGKMNDAVLVSSVEFDKEKLQPTYRYVEGISGASYAFAIAKQYHLNKEIIQEANRIKDENERIVEKEIEKLEVLQNSVLEKERKFDALIKDAHRIQREANESKKTWERKKKQLDEDYEEELRLMLEEKEQQAKKIIKVLKNKNIPKAHEQSDLLHQLRSMESNIQEDSSEKIPQFKVHDYVKLEDLNSHGEIIDIRRNEATVLTNGIKMKVKMSKLKPMKRPMVQPQATKHVDRVFKRFPLELNIIGMHVEEGLQALNNYLDKAIVNHATQVRIVHGMGTGALRQAVWKDLSTHPCVKQYMSAGPYEGGLGATIVVLK